ncbi:probable ubiquitin carboxyl-terminal hydrolase MINDY-4 [Homalodisca vitripennis]|uniref:probable ubiquitin carboxyl-terminal hydrolase MINDY-4 n=1 Tax=Homalodisca vitripennis TaxID=197043 RepID=UPI001EE9DCCC|nr:probable ubiquitin carboxyl-terminal hydrolase MINDY-4 [Homalodisca vitripennis]
MHPFHRKHTNGGTIQGHRTHNQGRFRNADRDENGDYKDPREEYNETLQVAMEYNRTHPKKYPPILSKNALKDKENVLLDSIKAFRSHTAYDNRTRLGPDKENTFQNLKRSRSTSAMEQASSLPSSASHSTLSEPISDSPLKTKSNSISLPHNQSEVAKTPEAEGGTNPDNLPNFLSSSPTRNEECNSTLVENLETSRSFDTSSHEIEESSDSNELLDLDSNGICDNFITATSEILGKNFDQSSTNSQSSKTVMINNLDSVTSRSNKDKESKSSLTEDQEKLLLSLKQRIKTNPIDKDEGLEDCDDGSQGLEEVEFIPLRLSSAVALKKLILGSAIRSFNLQWMGQSFVWSSNPKLRYGFSQNKGGACGVLASVQGFVLKSLLFHPNLATSELNPFRPTRQEVRRALVQALTEILWRAGDCRQAAIVRSDQESHLEECLVYRPDGLTEVLSWRKFLREKDLHEAVEKHLDEFISPHGKGCLRFVISVILSRGIQSVIADMDDETSPLIGPSGTCSVELVNLLLTGQAVSNVFDNDLQLDSCLLRGVSKRAEIGFLSIFEHFNSCQVGSNLKTPRYPIWLVNSDNHYSVVFSPCKQLVSDWRAERQFHLYHYDGLGGQAEETVLSVDTTGFSAKEESKRDEVPSLELCIKTKWKDAVVHWNSNFS